MTIDWKRALAVLAILTLATPSATAVFAYLGSGPKAAGSPGPACLTGSRSGPIIPSNISVALVKPIFTSTPYSQYAGGSFYAFYHKYVGTRGNITTDLDLLNTPVASGDKYSSGWGQSYPLYTLLDSPTMRNCGLVLGRNLHTITDINVSDGALFDSGGRLAFDAVIIGHQEYVTQSEYYQLKQFVASGGLLLAMSSNEFYAKVRYDPVTRVETFVLGHGGFAYNGKTAWYDPKTPVPWNMSGWFGSRYCCFNRFQFHGGVVNSTNPIGSLLHRYYGGTLAPTYYPDEENAVANLTRTSLIATFTHQSGLTIASYVHQYGRGAVVCLCVYGEQIIGTDRPTQFFIVATFAAGEPEDAVELFASNVAPSFLYLEVAAIIGIAGVVSSAFYCSRKATGR